jgi:N-acetyltransferase 10
MQPLATSIETELAEAAEEFKEQQQQKIAEIQAADLSRYAVGGAEDEWAETLGGEEPTVVSVRSRRKKRSSGGAEGRKMVKKKRTRNNYVETSNNF